MPLWLQCIVVPGGVIGGGVGLPIFIMALAEGVIQDWWEELHGRYLSPSFKSPPPEKVTFEDYLLRGRW